MLGLLLSNHGLLLLISPIASIIAAFLGSGIGSLISYCIHKGQMKHDSQEKEKDRQHEIKLKLIDKIEINSQEDLKEFFKNVSPPLSSAFELINDWGKVKEEIKN